MKEEEVILVGAGGHALSIAEFAGHRIGGYLANSPNEELDSQWLGTDEKKADLIGRGHKFHMAYIYSGLPIMEKRGRLIEDYQKSGAMFETLICPTSIVTPKSVVGEGSAIMAGAIINRAKLGEHVVVNSGAIVEHDCTVGSNTFIGPGVVIGGFTKIGKNCFIGLGAKIGNNVEIGDNISVAMGAVVNKNLTKPGIYHGNPLKCFSKDN